MIRKKDGGNADLLMEAILCLKNKEECAAFLEDILTIREMQDLSQRIAVASLLDEGESYASISQKTGASTTTISRVGRCYEYGSGSYKKILGRLSKTKEQPGKKAKPVKKETEKK